MCLYVCFLAPKRERVLSQKMGEMRLDVFRDISTGPPQYRFDLWDFGGQHAYYTSHQTFLSNRAIYLLTMDMSKQLDEELSTEVEVPKWKETGSPKTTQGTQAIFTTKQRFHYFYLVALNLFDAYTLQSKLRFPQKCKKTTRHVTVIF